jgi:hypothetical protein
MAQRIKINRSERRPPFLSNIVGGGAEQIQPNGCTYDKEPAEPDGIQGASLLWPVPRQSWGGNRSGE